MGAESDREVLYNAWEGGSREGGCGCRERTGESQEGGHGCQEEGRKLRGRARERAPAVAIPEVSYDIGDALHISCITYVKI